jgi:hypothetical protein
MKRHPLDPFSLVFGAAFAAIGLVFLFASVDVSSLHLRWLWPMPLIVVGTLIIALAARGEAGQRRAADAAARDNDSAGRSA